MRFVIVLINEHDDDDDDDNMFRWVQYLLSTWLYIYVNYISNWRRKNQLNSELQQGQGH